ncbi:expressed unknown protein [Seminavis robusta]|uniref:Uncharacterized protein n=1 Tax=Seminavis robusta TaxID=568900 RepID=A0A9N8EDN3_9STRA|nr:expressed unknown protein [Seminavis robusta]|eukprot:Sro938_g222270.1 n/a (357) ;mRNA; r:10277-11347
MIVSVGKYAPSGGLTPSRTSANIASCALKIVFGVGEARYSYDLISGGMAFAPESFLFGPNSTQQLDDCISRQHGSEPIIRLYIEFTGVKAGFFDSIETEDWTTFCEGIQSALPVFTKLIFCVHFASGHSEEKDDWFLSTLIGHMPTQTITEVTVHVRGGVGSVCIPKTWDALHPLVNVQALNLEASIQLDSLESLASVVTISLPRLTKLVFVADMNFGLRWDPLIEAVRTKKTLQEVDVEVYDTDALPVMCTFPFIHEIIQRCDLALTEGEPGNPSTAQLQPPTAEDTASLENWLNAMEHCLQERHRFDCFHYFFSKIDPQLYLNGEYYQRLCQEEAAARAEEANRSSQKRHWWEA